MRPSIGTFRSLGWHALSLRDEAGNLLQRLLGICNVETRNRENPSQEEVLCGGGYEILRDPLKAPLSRTKHYMQYLHSRPHEDTATPAQPPLSPESR